MANTTHMNPHKVAAPAVMPLGVDYLPAPYVEVDGDVTYRGWAPLGIQEDAPGWRLEKEQTVDGVVKHTYPQGSMDFRFVWADRKSYNYGR